MDRAVARAGWVLAKVRYAAVARGWAAVFAAVALLFAVVPGRVGPSLSTLGHFLGLSGEIATPADNLWWVLALSLMVSVTGLAWHSAHDPTASGPYRILLAAKLASTAGFVWLAWRLTAPVWLLCAAGDGFVALTLWLARLGEAGRAATSSVPDGFARVYRGQRPFYEVWFGKLNIAPGQAFWFRYTLLDGQSREAGTWAIAFDRDLGLAAGRSSQPIEELPAHRGHREPETGTRQTPGGRPAAFDFGTNHLQPGNAMGSAADLGWDLTFVPAGDRRHDHVPWLLKALGLARTRYVTPFGDLRFSGMIHVAGRAIPVVDAPGMIGHIYGSRSGHSWAWAHCNTFEGRPDVVFEGLSARVRIGGAVSPPLSSFVLWVGERCFRFTSPVCMLRARSVYGAGHWSFRAEAGGAVVEGEAAAPSEDQVALVTYTDTDGSQQWCRNSKLADLRLRLIEPGGRVEEFVAARTAAFELVDRVPPDRPALL